MPAPYAVAATAALIRQLMLKGLTRKEATKVVAQTKTPRQLQKVGMKEGIDKAGQKAGEAYQKLRNQPTPAKQPKVKEPPVKKLPAKKPKVNEPLVKNPPKFTKAKTPKNIGGKTAAGVAIPSSTGGKKSSTSKPSDDYSLPTVDVPSQITMSKGGKVKKTGARRGDGCAVRGKTRGRMI